MIDDLTPIKQNYPSLLESWEDFRSIGATKTSQLAAAARIFDLMHFRGELLAAWFCERFVVESMASRPKVEFIHTRHEMYPMIGWILGAAFYDEGVRYLTMATTGVTTHGRRQPQ